MVWIDRDEEEEDYPYTGIEVIEDCFMRKGHPCNKVRGGATNCFIASPSDDKFAYILEIVSDKLEKQGIEPYIAVRKREYGQDIICLKICGRIIESKFCIVILDDDVKDEIKVPNPNVYYEYGLMTALGKHIIPLQQEGEKLAFNIQHVDTIKYSSTTIGPELDLAIRDAITQIKEKEKENREEEMMSEQYVLRKLDLGGFEVLEDHELVNKISNGTLFKCFYNEEMGSYLFLGKIDVEEELSLHSLDIDYVIHRAQRFSNKMERELQDMKRRKEKMDMNRARGDSENFSWANIALDSTLPIQEKILEDLGKIYIGFVINPSVEATDFLKKSAEIIEKQPGFNLLDIKDFFL